MRVIRAGEHIQYIPGYGISVRESSVAVAAANWWEVPGKTCVAAYQPKGATSYAASKVNLANPGTYNAYEGVAPAFDAATGWTFDASQYLLTGITYISPTYSIAVRCTRTGGPGGHEPIVLANAWPPAMVIEVYLGAHTYFMTGLATWVEKQWTLPDDDVLCAAGVACFYNGVFLGNSGSAASSKSLGIHTKWGGAGASGFLGHIAAIAVYSDTLTSGQVTSLTAAMAAL